MAFLFGACTAVYGIDPTELAPTVDGDSDDDEVPNIGDNCPVVANPTQADEDDDDVGDACDNCPLIPNASQEDFDADASGDVCDPHPGDHGDCLVLFDSFGDTTRFAARWRVDASGTGTAEASDGFVHIVAPAQQRVALFANDENAAPLIGDFEIQVVGQSTRATASPRVLVTANAAGTDVGYQCSAQEYSSAAIGRVVAIAAPPGVTPMSVGAQFSGRAVNTTMVLRLVHRARDGSSYLRCRIENGVALGVSALYPTTPQIASGEVGVIVSGETFDVHAAAVYRYAPGAACQEPVRR